MRALGIDPSLRSTGYGVVEEDGAGYRLIEGGVLAPLAGAAFESRLAELSRGLSEIIAGLRPDVMVIEEVYSRPSHPRTAILMAHARGALVCAAALARLPVVDYAATTVKVALVGRGTASKEQVAAMVVRLLGLRRRPSPADVTDALALAIVHLRRNGHRPHAVLERSSTRRSTAGRGKE